MITAKRNRVVLVASTLLLAQFLPVQLLNLSFQQAAVAANQETSMVLKGAYDPSATTEASAQAPAAAETAAATTATPTSTDTTAGTTTAAEPAKAATTSGEPSVTETTVDLKDKKIESGISISTSSKLKCVEFAPSKDPFEEAINTAAIVAMERDPEVVEADNKLFKMQGSGQNAKEISKNFLHYLLNYRGVGPSSSGANALMERKINSSSTLAAELKWEKAVDEKYVSTVNACAELADALDREDATERDQALADATANLNVLVGEEEAAKLVTKFKNLKATLPNTIPNAGSLGVAAERARIRTLEEAVIKQDPILSTTTQKLAKYTVTTKTEVVTGAIQSALGVAGLAPSLIGPCAQLVKTAFILSTGGSEENKLYKEVFLFKRIEVRARTISQLSSTAVRSYHMACLTKRPLLAAYSQSLMSKMTDKDTVEKIVSGNLDTRIAAPTTHAAALVMEANKAKEEKSKKEAAVETKNEKVKEAAETKPEVKAEATQTEVKTEAKTEEVSETKKLAEKPGETVQEAQSWNAADKTAGQ